MPELRTTTMFDIERIKRWISVDPYHKDGDIPPEDLLTGKGKLCFCLTDSDGPLCYVRLDSEGGDLLRLATQFGPREEVSARRLVVGMLEAGIPAILHFAKDKGYKGVIFRSTSPSLIAFMKKQEFEWLKENDYMRLV